MEPCIVKAWLANLNNWLNKHNWHQYWASYHITSGQCQISHASLLQNMIVAMLTELCADSTNSSNTFMRLPSQLVIAHCFLALYKTASLLIFKVRLHRIIGLTADTSLLTRCHTSNDIDKTSNHTLRLLFGNQTLWVSFWGQCFVWKDRRNKNIKKILGNKRYKKPKL